MKWRLSGDWPVGQSLVPAGTVLSADDGEAPIWNGQPLPMPPPLNAVALDDETALAMAMAYDAELWRWLVFDRGVDREAILAQAAYNKQYPNGPPALKAEEKPARKRK